MSIDPRAKLTTALKTFVLCNPATIAPMSAMSIDLRPRQTAPLRVTSAGFTLGEAYGRDTRAQAHAIARGMLHVMLGHPAALRDAIKRLGAGIRPAFDIACQIQVEAIIQYAPSMPSGMFHGDERIAQAMHDAGISARDGITLEDILVKIAFRPLAILDSVVQPAKAGDVAHQDVAHLVALAMDRGTSLTDTIGTLLGMTRADGVDTTGEAETLLSLPQVRTIEEGLTAVETSRDQSRFGTMPVGLIAASVLEMVVKTLKGILRPRDVSRAFQAASNEMCDDIFAAGPLIRL